MSKVIVEPEKTSALLHPGLQKLAAIYRRRLRLLGLLLFLMMGGLMMFAMVSALTSQTLGDLLTLGLMGLLVLPAVTLAGGLMWYVDRWSLRELGTANQLLLAGAPRMARLTPLKSAATGHLMELLLPTEAPIYAVFERFIYPLPPEGIEVELYSRQLTRGSELIVLPPNSAALLGKVVERKAWERRGWLGPMILLIITITYAIYWLYER